jgi:glycosyltransferase involved in cell wall biosynthesis
MKSVIHVITTISMGGAEKQLLTLASEQAKSGREVKVIFLKGTPELEADFEESGVSIYGSIANRNPFIQVFLLAHHLKNIRDTIVHAHLPRAELICSLVLSKRNNLIVSRHNSEPFFPGAPSVISRFLSNYVVSKSKYVIAISEAVKKFLIDTKEVRNLKKIEVVYYGFSLTKVLDTSFVDNIKYKEVRDKQLVIGTVSRLVPQKDLKTLIKGFSIFNNRFPGAYLVVVGEGNLKSELIDYSRDLGIENNVIWFGRTSQVELVIREFDIFALTSVYEGFGLVLLEAIASGVPIVAARNSAIPEVLGSDYEGLFETGNSEELAKLIEQSLNSEQNQRMKNQMANRINTFLPGIMRTKIDGLYSLTEKK